MTQQHIVCTGLEKSLKNYHVLEKSLKIEKLWDIREKSLNVPQKSLNINFLKAPWIKLTFVKKKNLRKGMIESIATHEFSCLGDHESVFL